MSIRLANVSKDFGNTKVLSDISVEIEPGEFFVMVGPSGSGKSTLLRMIAGLTSVTDGRIYFNERDVTDLPPKDRKLAMVFQNYALLPFMNVAQNVRFGLENQDLTDDEKNKRVDWALDLVHLTDLRDRKPKELSGGQQQRVSLARALATKAPVVLMDEPLSNLDAQLRTEMREEIARLHREIGMTLIYVTHDQVEAMTMGDNHPANEFVAKFIGSPEMNLLPITVSDEGDRFSIGDTFWTDNAFVLPFDLPAGSYHLGIRPEKLVPVSIANPDTITAKVKSLQQLGNDTLIFCDFDGQSLVSRVPEQFTVAVGAELNLLLPANADEWHLFNIDDGERIAVAPVKEAAAYGA